MATEKKVISKLMGESSGVAARNHPFVAEKNKLFQRLIDTCWVTVAIYAVMCLYLGAQVSAGAMLVGALTLSPLARYLSRVPNSKTARVVFVVSSLFYIYGGSYGFKHMVGAEYYLLPAMMLAPLLFEADELLNLIFCGGLPLVTWALIKWGPAPIAPQGAAGQSFPYERLRDINFIGASALTAIFLWLFIRAQFKIRSLGIAALETKESILRNTIDSMQEGLVVQDETARIIEFNSSALKHLGLTEDQLLGRTSMDPRWRALKNDGTDFVGSEHPAMVTIRTGKPVYDVEMGVERPEGGRIWIKINSVPIEFEVDPITKETKTKKLICTFSDFTEQKLLRDQAEGLSERLKLAIRAVKFGVWDWNIKTAALDLDDLARQIFEIEKEGSDNHFGVLGEMISTQDIERIKKELAQAFAKNEENIKTEFMVTTRAGQVKYIEAVAHCFYDQEGQVRRIVGTCRDLTRRKLADEKINQITMWQQAVLDGSNYAMISTDVDGTILSFNRAAEKMLGYRASEIVGVKNPGIFHDPEEIVARAKHLSQELGKAIEPGFDVFVVKLIDNRQDVHDWTYIRKDGSRFPVRLCATAIFDEAWKLVGYLGVAEDITEQNALKQTISEQQMQIVNSAKMSSLGEMAGGIAHEINNPLAIISGKVSLLKHLIGQSTIDPQKFKEEFEKIDSTVTRIATIVRGLKLFSRNSSEDPMAVANVATIVKDTLGLCGSRFKHHSVDITVVAPENLSVECRDTQISQVLLNLLSNAYDAIYDLDKKWIRIEIESVADRIQFKVTDSGAGIAPKVVEKMMDPFYTTKEVGKGTGLGLSISKGIVEAHQGRFWYDSESNNTRFVFELPNKQKERSTSSADQVIRPGKRSA